MRRWYKYETGNERRKDALGTFLRRSGIHYEIVDDSKNRRCDWWIVQILADDPKQVDMINTWLHTH